MQFDSRNSIVYYCGKSVVSFDPADESLAGSEQAIVQLCNRWANMGYQVTVYGRVPNTVKNRVLYCYYTQFVPDHQYNILILWRECAVRSIQNMLIKPRSRVVLLDLHDATHENIICDPWLQQYITCTMVKSNYHRKLYPCFAREDKNARIHVQPNGLLVDLYNEISQMRIQRQPLRFCYTSNYDRGLIELLDYGWDLIRNAVPGAELHVYYGMKESWESYKRVAKLLQKPGIFHHGRRTNREVAMEKFSSSLNLYPSHSLTEVDCINVRESVMAGCIPIISSVAVFSERDGIHVAGDPRKREYYTRYAEVVAKLAISTSLQERMREQLRKSQHTYTWDLVAARWGKIMVAESAAASQPLLSFTTTV